VRRATQRPNDDAHTITSTTRFLLVPSWPRPRARRLRRHHHPWALDSWWHPISTQQTTAKLRNSLPLRPANQLRNSFL